VSGAISPLPGVLILQPRVSSDQRGRFLESWHARRYAEAGLPEHWVQDNVSWSRRGVLRGLHFQHPRAQGKLVSVLMGEIFDVAVDLRGGSPTFGRWAGFDLSAENARQLYLPPGCAHGFVVRSEEALVTYKCTEFYQPETEITLRWDDPDLAIEWPIEHTPILSTKDRAGISFRELTAERLPPFLV
jgi:dTDP-4-dehydrorhamnose 3,5-epimerase